MPPRAAGAPFDAGNRRVLVPSPTSLVSVGFGPAAPNEPNDRQPGVAQEVTAYVSGYDEVAPICERPARADLRARGRVPTASALERVKTLGGDEVYALTVPRRERIAG